MPLQILLKFGIAGDGLVVVFLGKNIQLLEYPSAHHRVVLIQAQAQPRAIQHLLADLRVEQAAQFLIRWRALPQALVALDDRRDDGIIDDDAAVRATPCAGHHVE